MDFIESQMGGDYAISRPYSQRESDCYDYMTEDSGTERRHICESFTEAQQTAWNKGIKRARLHRCFGRMCVCLLGVKRDN